MTVILREISVVGVWIKLLTLISPELRVQLVPVQLDLPGITLSIQVWEFSTLDPYVVTSMSIRLKRAGKLP